jgi:TusA-related sulfurtransferase
MKISALNKLEVEKIYSIKPNRTLNCIGFRCPEPVFRTRIEVDKISVNETLEVIADDPAAEEDISSLVRRLGQELISIRRDGNILHILIRKIK